MMMNPTVTVLMPVYNGEAYLHEAIESVLDQTFRDFEFLIINDGSTDNSVSIIQSFADPRIRLIHNESNIKIAATLNKGLQLAKGQYIARMDCDDISMPTRLADQVAYMEANPGIGILASNMRLMDGGTVYRAALSSEDIQFQLLFHCCLAHPTIMIRRQELERHQLHYRQVASEDYDLWVRAARLVNIVRTEEPLLYYRHHDAQATKIEHVGIKHATHTIIMEQLRQLGIFSNEMNWEAHYTTIQLLNTVRGKRHLFTYKDVSLVLPWLRLISERNQTTQFVSQKTVDAFIDRVEQEREDYQQKLSIFLRQSKGRNVYLFGSGKLGAVYFDYVQGLGVGIAGFLDNSPEKVNLTVKKLPILSPDILLIERGNAFVIIASSYTDEMSKQLERMGLVNEVDFISPLY